MKFTSGKSDDLVNYMSRQCKLSHFLYRKPSYTAPTKVHINRKLKRLHASLGLSGLQGQHSLALFVAEYHIFGADEARLEAAAQNASRRTR